MVGRRADRPATEILFVDPRVPDYRRLLDGLDRAVRVIVVNPRREGLQQIAEAVEGLAPVGAVQILAHGAAGHVAMGRSGIDLASLTRNPALLARLRRTLSGAPVQIMACEVGADARGRTFLDSLSASLDAPVSAPEGRLGRGDDGGCWVAAGPPCAVASLIAKETLRTHPATLANYRVSSDDGGNTVNDSFGQVWADDPIVDGDTVQFRSQVRDATINLTVTVTISADASHIGADNLTINGTEIAVASGKTFLFDGGTISIGSAITGAGHLQADGGTAMTLTGTSNTYGQTSVTGSSSLSISADANLGTGTVTLDGGTLSVTGATTIDNAVSFGGGHGTVAIGADVTFSGVLSGSGNLTKTGSSTLTLSGANTYSGTTSVTGGGLTISSDANLGSGTLTLDGATLSVTGATTVDNAVSLGASHATISNSTAVAFSGVLSGSGNLTKSGSGTLILGGTNTYGGTTTVSGGTLAVNGAISTGTVTVASGATLGGSGSISGDVTVQSGATLAPGESAGSLSTGNLTLASGSTLEVELNGLQAGVTFDQLVVTGTVDLGGATLSTNFGFTSATDNCFVVVSNDGTDTVANTFSGLAEGAEITSNGRTYQISYAGGDGNDISLTDVTPAGGGSTTSSPVTLSNPDELSVLSSGTTDQVTLMTSDASYDNGSLSLSMPADSTVTNLRLEVASSVNPGTSGLTINLPTQGTIGTATVAIPSAVTATKAATVNLNASTTNLTLCPSETGDALVVGNTAANQLTGNGGQNTLVGGDGDDTLSGNIGLDVLYGNLGSDQIYGNVDEDTLFGGQGGDSLYGGSGSDQLHGNRNDDTLFGNRDDDLIYGNLGGDVCYGGDGDDVVYGGQGFDQVSGDDGNDTIFGNRDPDRLLGGGGGDVLYGNTENDTLSGGVGDDTLYGGQEDDLLSGGAGADLLYGNLGADSISAGSGDDTLYGGAGDDLLSGGAGDDTLVGGDGTDSLAGGDGADTFMFTDAVGDNVVLDFELGVDQLVIEDSGTDTTTVPDNTPFLPRGWSWDDGPAVIELAGGGSVTLIGISQSQITSDIWEIP